MGIASSASRQSAYGKWRFQIRTCVLVALLFFATVGFGQAEYYKTKGNTGSYSVEVRFDGTPSVKGRHTLEIIIMDLAMKPVTDATVVVKYLMPSLPGKPPMMDYEVPATREGRKYIAVADLSMVGEWEFIIKITRTGNLEMMKFGFFVR